MSARIPDYSDPSWLAQLASVGESWPGTGGTSTAGGGGGTPPFNLNAPSRTGQGPFGNVPGAIGLPPVYNDVAGTFPGLSGNLAQFSKNVGSALKGELSEPTIAMLQNTAAQFGIGAGTPLSPFSGAAGLRHVARATEEQQAQGANSLLGGLSAISKNLTVDPSLQTDVANRNATFNAAPDPAAANAQAQALFNAYLKKTAAGGGQSFGGGGGSAAPRNQNAPGFQDMPWAPAGGAGAAFGTGAGAPPPYQGGLPNFGQQPTPSWMQPQGPELGQWGQQGPEQGMWDAPQQPTPAPWDPLISGDWGEGQNQNAVYPPEWA